MSIKDNICFGFQVSDKANTNAFQKVKNVFIQESSPCTVLSTAENTYMGWLQGDMSPPNKYTNKAGTKFLLSKYLPNSYLSAKSICESAHKTMSTTDFAAAGKTEMQRVIKNNKQERPVKNYIQMLDKVVMEGKHSVHKKTMSKALSSCITWVEAHYND